MFATISLNADFMYSGLTGSEFENGAGDSFIHFKNREYALRLFDKPVFEEAAYIHAFMRFAERMSSFLGCPC